VKVRVEDITAEAKQLSFDEPAEELNHILGIGPVREFQIEGPIKVTVSYYRAGTELFFMGDLHTTTRAVCARCTEEFAASSDRGFRFVLSPRAAGLGEENDLRYEDLEFSVYDGDEIDLSPLVREQVLLSLPTRSLCDEECRGLCPRCGTNRNYARCGCSAAAVDPRLAILRTVKLGRR
jgi:DUF177 domain-containing protein